VNRFFVATAFHHKHYGQLRGGRGGTMKKGGWGYGGMGGMWGFIAELGGIVALPTFPS
jgi:hypothetical protein